MGTKHRPTLIRLVSDPTAGAIVVEHRDRLMRFGVEDVEAAVTAQGRRMVVVEPGDGNDDLARAMIDVLTRLCARRYGRRSAHKRAKNARKALACEDSSRLPL